MSPRYLAALILGIALLLPGCGSHKTPRTITFAVGGTPTELNYWQVLIDRFQKQSGIKVQIVRQPSDTDLRRQNLVVALRAGKSDPDVMLMDVAWLAQFAASGWLEPLDANMPPHCADKKDFFSRVINLADTSNHRLVALPIFVDGGLLYYRKDLLAQYGIPGPPKTWDELLTDARLVQEKERDANPDFYGFVWQGAQYEGLICNFLEFAGSGGGFVFDHGKPSLDNPTNVESLQFMRDLIHRYKVSPPNTYTEMHEEETRSYFQQGNALFERNWAYAWALHQKPSSPVRGKIGLAPMPAHRGASSISTLGGWHIGLSAQSDDKEDARQLICFLTSASVQKDMALYLGWNPGNVTVYQGKKVLAKAPQLKQLRAIFTHATPRPLLPYYSQLSVILQKHLSDALAGNTSTEQALRQADSEMLPITKRYQSSGEK